MKIFFFTIVIFSFNALAGYPRSWWKEIPRDEASSWEVLPQDAGPGEVVLSKRTELGVFSNLADTPFSLDGVLYASVEGLWQMLKYPSDLFDDPRHDLAYYYNRDEVRFFSGFKAKKAGDYANKLMRENGIDWVSYQGEKFNYKDFGEGSEKHYQLILRAMKNKIHQNKNIYNLLIRTKGLRLIPDHRQGVKPKSYYYHEILMMIRDELI